MSVDIRLKHSSIKDKAPVAADLKNGELALSIHPDSPAAYIKDSDGNIVKLAGENSVSTDTDAVKKSVTTSQNMAGDLTLGTDKIDLDASTGTVIVNTDDGGTTAFSGRVSGSENVQINSGGSAMFANTAIKLNSDGTAEFTEKITVPYSGQDATLWLQNGPSASSGQNSSINFGHTEGFGSIGYADAVNNFMNFKVANKEIVRMQSYDPDSTYGDLRMGVGMSLMDAMFCVYDSANFAYESPLGNYTPHIKLEKVVTTDEGGDQEITGKITADDLVITGDATLAGGVEVNKSYSAGSVFKIYNEGGNLGSYFYNDGTSTQQYLCDASGAATITLKGNDGSATFAGAVATNTLSATNTLYNPVFRGITGGKNTSYLCANGQLFLGEDITPGANGAIRPDGFNIRLHGENGSATFAGNVTAGNGTFAGAGTAISASGNIYIQGSTADVSNSNTALSVVNPSDFNTPKVTIRHDGSASFAGRVDIGDQVEIYRPTDKGGDTPSNTLLALKSDVGGTSVLKASITAEGSANFAGSVQSGTWNGATGEGVLVNSKGRVDINQSTGTENLWVGRLGGAITSSIQAEGSATFQGTVTATVVPPSDARFKENIEPAKPQLADVVALGGLLKNYDWNDQAPLNEEIRSQRQLGLIAQEAETVCPTIVKDIHRTKQGDVITPEETIPAVYEDKVVPAEYKTVIVVPAKLGPKGKEIVPATTEEVLVTPEYTEQVLVTPEQVIPATYEVLDDSYKGISSEALIMKLIGAVTELSAEVAALKAAKLTKK